MPKTYPIFSDPMMTTAPPSSSGASLADNEDFIRLIQVAGEDAGVRRALLSLLSLDPFHRQSALATWLEQLRLKGAPSALLRAISCLADPDVADKALTLLHDRSLR